MEDFFEEVESRKQAWPAGRADLHWHILFDPAVLQEQLAGPYREITHRPGLAPVEVRWMHTTLVFVPTGADRSGCLGGPHPSPPGRHHGAPPGRRACGR